MRAFIILAVILAATQALPLSEVQRQWNKFKLDYGKQYANEAEEKMRMEIFTKNVLKYAEHNKKYEAGLVRYTEGVNQFADMTREEFAKTFAPMNIETPPNVTFFDPPNVDLPDSVDWRDNNAVTPVKDQGQCGSCYSFSATGALEGQIAIKTGQLVSLSEQNIVDCSTQYGNGGCTKGYFSKSFEYIQNNGGIDTEESYPYTGVQGECHYDPANSGATVSGYQMVQQGDENALKSAVATIGPISVGINGAPIMGYTSGVFHADCDENRLNHAVLVVGYSTTSDGEDYWIVKNSYGASWGEGGYIRLPRNVNKCGIATQPAYPTI